MISDVACKNRLKKLLNVRLAGDHLCVKLEFTWQSLGVFHGVFLCRPFSHEMSWMRSWTKLSQCLRGFLPTLLIFVILNSKIEGHAV